MEVDENTCQFCNEILGSDVIEEVKSFEELAIELKNSRPPNVEYNEENKLRTSGIIKWLLQNATKQTIDESDIDKIVDQCIYSEESEIIDILKSHGVFIVVPRAIDINILENNSKYSLIDYVSWHDSAMCRAVIKGTPDIMNWILSFQINTDVVENEVILNKLLENAGDVGNLNTIKKLLDLGANINHEEDEYKKVLETAAENGHYHVVEWLINNYDFDVHILEQSLQLAVKENNYDIIKLLVDLGTIDINSRSGLEETCIHLAAMNGNVSVIKYFKDLGTEFLAVDHEGANVVHIAAVNGDLKLLKWLNTQGALEEFRKNGYTPLFDAAVNNHLECVKYLVHNNYDVDAKNYQGLSVLHFAAKSRNIEIIKFLVSHGANPLVIDDDQNTLMHAAALQNSIYVSCSDMYLKDSYMIDLIKLMVSYGVNVHAENTDEETILHLALEDHEFTVVLWLIENGMDAKVLLSFVKDHIHGCKSEDKKLLNLCIECLTDIDQFIDGEPLLYSCAPYPQAVKILIAKNADVNVKLADGSTPLMKSLSRNDDSACESAQILLNHGADINAITTDGKSALYCAVQYNYDINFIKKLLDLGADVNAGNALKKHIILHAALEHGDNLNVVKLFVEAGADVNCKNCKNESAINVKVYVNKVIRWKIIKYLVENGADVNHFTNKPILFKAIETGDVELVSCLLHHGARTDIIFEEDDAIIHTCTKILDEESKIKIVKLLITHGADINGLSYDDEETILLHFITNIEMVDYLIKAGIDINIQNVQGITALHYVLMKHNFKNNIQNQIKIVFKLINNGANINHVDDNGNTPLHLAVANPHCSEVAKLLVKKGANVNAKNNDGDSILHNTCLGELGMWLISKGANVNAKNNKGVTVLQNALQNCPKKDLKCQNIVTSIVNSSIKCDLIPSTTLASLNTSRYIEYIHVLIDTVDNANIIHLNNLELGIFHKNINNCEFISHIVKRLQMIHNLMTKT